MMTNSFATIEDVTNLWRSLTPEEKERAEHLLPLISDCLREEAYKVKKDLDKMIEDRVSLRSVVKSVTIDVLGRTLLTSTENEPMIQTSESALGYSASATFLVPGGGLFIKNAELARIGLKRQRIGVIDLYDSQGNNNQSY